MSNINTEDIKIDDYILIAEIGQGSFGRVRLCKSRKTGEFFALKILKKTTGAKKGFFPNIYYKNNRGENIKNVSSTQKYYT